MHTFYFEEDFQDTFNEISKGMGIISLIDNISGSSWGTDKSLVQFNSNYSYYSLSYFVFSENLVQKNSSFFKLSYLLTNFSNIDEKNILQDIKTSECF